MYQANQNTEKIKIINSTKYLYSLRIRLQHNDFLNYVREIEVSHYLSFKRSINLSTAWFHMNS